MVTSLISDEKDDNEPTSVIVPLEAFVVLTVIEPAYKLSTYWLSEPTSSVPRIISPVILWLPLKAKLPPENTYIFFWNSLVKSTSEIEEASTETLSFTSE